MKKKLSLFAIVALTICLVIFAFGRFEPASPVQAASKTHLALIGSGSSEEKAISRICLRHPFMFVVAGLVFVLLGIMAASPLLINNPALRREAGIYLGGARFVHESGREVEPFSWSNYLTHQLANGEFRLKSLLPSRRHDPARAEPARTQIAR